MSGDQCGATYSLREWRLEHDADPEFEALFDSDGEWRCPRAAVGDADRCPFHLSRTERASRIDDEQLSERFVAELRGETSVPPDRRGEFLAISAGDLVVDEETIPDGDGPNAPEHAAIPSGDPVYLVAATVDRFVIEDVDIDRRFVLDGTVVTRGIRSSESSADESRAAGERRGESSGQRVPRPDPGREHLERLSTDELQQYAADIETVESDADRETTIDQILSYYEYYRDALSIIDAEVGALCLRSTRVRGPICIEGDGCTVDEVELADGTITDRTLWITQGATVEDTVVVRGMDTEVESVTIDNGATVGTVRTRSGRRSTDRARSLGGVRVAEGGLVETELRIQGQETMVTDVAIEGGVTGSLKARDGASVPGAIDVDGGTVETTVEVAVVDGRPALRVSGKEARLEQVEITGTTIDRFAIRDGASVSGVLGLGQSKVEDPIEIAGPDTAVNTLYATDGTSIESGLRVRDAATVRERIAISGGASIESPPVGDADAALLVQGTSTEVAAIDADDGATIQGLSIENATVTDGIEIDSATVSPLDRSERRAGATGAGDRDVKEDSQSPADPGPSIQVVDAAVFRRLAVRGSDVRGAVEFARATVRTIEFGGDATVGAPVRIRDGTVVERDVVVSTREESTGEVTFEADYGVVVGDARVEGDVRIESALAATDQALRLINADVTGNVSITAPAIDGDLALLAGTVVGRDVELRQGATVEGTVLLSGATTVDQALTLDGVVVGALTLSDATVKRGAAVVGDTTIHGPVRLRQDAAVGGDLVFGSEPDVSGAAVDAESVVGADTSDSSADVRGPAEASLTAIEEIVLGDVAGDHPTSGGVSVAGSLALVGDVSVERGVSLGDATVDGDLAVADVAGLGGLRLDDSSVDGKVVVSDSAVTVEDDVSLGDGDEIETRDGTGDDDWAIALLESAIGEDVRLVGEDDRTRAGPVTIEDTIVKGKVRVDRATVDSLHIRESRVGESVWIGPTERALDDERSISEREDNRTEINGDVAVIATPVAENLILRWATLGGLDIAKTLLRGNITVRDVEFGGDRERAMTLDDAIVGGRVTVETATLRAPLAVEQTHVMERFELSDGWLAGLEMEATEVDRTVQIGPRTSPDERTHGIDARDGQAGGAEAPETYEKAGAGSSATTDGAGLTIAGPLDLAGTVVGGDLSVTCSVVVENGADCPPTLAETTVEGAVELVPHLDGCERVSLVGATLPAGWIVIDEPDGVDRRFAWYDLRQATLGEVDVAFGTPDPGRSAVDQLLLLETEFDGFRFSAVEGNLSTDGNGLHTVAGDQLVNLPVEDEVPTGCDGEHGGLFCRLTRLGAARWFLPDTGHEPGDPPPARLERTYLNAKNGASQVGDEDIAGHFFIREKRYRRRRYWERLCGGDDHRSSTEPDPDETDRNSTEGDRNGDASPSSARADSTGRATHNARVVRATRDTLSRWATLWGWLKNWGANATLDAVAVYGERPRRVVWVAAEIVFAFAIVFALALDRPPYVDQYRGNGVLPESLALAIQPLILSIESFVTLVLVGPADQRLTPFVHLIGQIEGFLGVFFVALFVFTLTRSIHR